ncbi:MAG: UTP--glucose-1-phosphate uridylyltransferase [Simkaniaceae bacterium]
MTLIRLNDLPESYRDRVQKRLKAYDIEALLSLQKLVRERSKKCDETPYTLLKAKKKGFPLEQKKSAEAFLREKKVAALILAGGQGSRLGVKGPKGALPVSLIKKKTLFELMADRIKAASRLAGGPLPAALITSALNHEETLSFFQKHKFFGLHPNQIDFVPQKMWPFFDENGELFLNESGNLAEGPNGNGYSFHLLKNHQILKKWKEMGVELINTIPIDNPLADPFDLRMIGQNLETPSDLVIKTISSKGFEEEVGLLAFSNNELTVKEYSERAVKKEEGLAYSGMFMTTLDFADFIASKLHFLPFHFAKKEGKRANFDQGVLKEIPITFIKLEAFIFDLFKQAKKVSLLLTDPEEAFSPIKQQKGKSSYEKAQADLWERDRKMYKKIFKKEAPLEKFELDSVFYYLTEEEIQKIEEITFDDNNYLTLIF